MSEITASLHESLEQLTMLLRCSICCSTLGSNGAPSQLPCIHIFCQDCIKQHLKTKLECPECRTPCTRRSVTSAAHVSKVVRAYRSVSKSFGVAPTIWNEDCYLTQPEVQCTQWDGDGMEDLLVSRKMGQDLTGWKKKFHEENVLKFNEADVARRKAEDREAEEEEEEEEKKERDIEKEKEKEIEQEKEDEVDNFPENDDDDHEVAKSPPPQTTEPTPTPKTFKTVQPPPITFRIGMDVLHETHGKGVVAVVKEKGWMKVDFKGEEIAIRSTSLQTIPHLEPLASPAPSSPSPPPSSSLSPKPASPEPQPQTTTTTTTTTITSSSHLPHFPINTTVEVQARTWTNINKPGGTATITNVTETPNGPVYDVKYVIGTLQEKNVDAKFVTLHKELDRGRRRFCVKREKEDIDPQIPNPDPNSISKSKESKLMSSKKRRRARSKSSSSSNPSPFQAPFLSSTTPTQTLTQPRHPIPTAPQISPSQISDLAFSRYSRLLTPRDNKLTYVISGFSLDNSDQTEATNEIHKLGEILGPDVQINKVARNVTNSTNFLITKATQNSSSNDGVFKAEKRTLKTMQCIARGIPIVTVDYIRSCVAAKKIVAPTKLNAINTIPTKSSTPSSDLGVFKAAATMETTTDPVNASPFSKVAVYLVGDFLTGQGGPKKDDCIALLNDLHFKVIDADWKAAKLISQKRQKANPRLTKSINHLVLLCDNDPKSFPITGSLR
ncbi:hypothetical protein TL16_g03796 [Triparma laevis f. inornata]|uniref:RING-type E3 ubiquitin transferase BRCA1 n=1 Tax=Triparma laevis f. inornata TaxID=1714386 RepID=A0A9W7A6G3_9STRA|nr:hypothetical protein TL16_g03796 [Triparma laevis f. inornata]